MAFALLPFAVPSLDVTIAQALLHLMAHQFHVVRTIAIDENHLRVAFSSVDAEKLESVFTTIFKVAEEMAK